MVSGLRLLAAQIEHVTPTAYRELKGGFREEPGDAAVFRRIHHHNHVCRRHRLSAAQYILGYDLSKESFHRVFDTETIKFRMKSWHSEQIRFLGTNRSSSEQYQNTADLGADIKRL